MSLSAVLIVLVLAAESTPLKVAAPGLNTVNVDAKLAEFYAEHLAQELKRQGLEVVTKKETTMLLGLERQKALLGCTDVSCMAELSSALGAEAVLLGDVARLKDGHQLNLKLISASTAKTLTTYTEQVGLAEDDVVSGLTRAGAQLAAGALLATGRPGPRRGPSPALALTVLGLGVALAGAGTAGVVYSESAYAALQGGSPGARATALRRDGEVFGNLGVAALAVGGAALATGVVLLIAGRAASSPSPAGQVTVSALPFPGGGGLVVGGSLP